MYDAGTWYLGFSMVRDVTEGEKKTLWTEPPKDYILVLIQDLNLTINLTKLNTFDLSLVPNFVSLISVI